MLLRREEAAAPVSVGKINGFMKKFSLFKWDIKLEFHPSDQTSFGKQEVTPAGCATYSKVIRTHVNLIERSCYRVCGRWFLVGWEAHLLPARGVYHVAAEQQDLAR